MGYRSESNLGNSKTRQVNILSLHTDSSSPGKPAWSLQKDGKDVSDVHVETGTMISGNNDRLQQNNERKCERVRMSEEKTVFTC